MILSPREKAKELVDKFKYYSDVNHNGNFENAKQCAIIAVDEILNDDMFGMEEECFEKRINYWEDVKKEIELL